MLFLKMSQNSRKHLCRSIFLSAVSNCFKIERLRHRCFHVNFNEVLKKHFFYLTNSGGCFFALQDAKHKNTLRQLHAMGSLFDGKYSQWGSRFLPILVTRFLPITECINNLVENPKAVGQRCSVKKVFLETWQNSQESSCARDSF